MKKETNILEIKTSETRFKPTFTSTQNFASRELPDSSDLVYSEFILFIKLC